MLLGIVSIVLVTVLTIMQFIASSRLIRLIAVAIGFIVIVIGAIDLYQREKEKEFTINALERIGTSIDWKKSSFILELLNDMEEVRINGIRVDLKLLSFNKTRLPGTAKISMTNAKSRSVIDDKWKYFFLKEDDAYALFNAFAEKDGSIYLDKEKTQNVQNFMYVGSDITKDIFQGVVVRLKKEYGPDAQSPYLSLSDLNNTFLVARIQTHLIKNPLPAWLYIRLQTNFGEKLIHLPIKLLPDERKAFGVLDFRPVRYVGIYFPDQFFGIMKGVITQSKDKILEDNKSL